ncbi:unnamed protein product [Ilex paraguariensis]|uniref:SHSP domain-containing protein n=1 Tax=Ilex paraguariensis TaxID=185542 RepID=A0ABC8QQN5_9AQUA
MATSSYEEFDPLCTWRHDGGHKTLVIHLPHFHKEQLKIHICNFGAMKISGERPLSATKRYRFSKEVKIPEDINAHDIHAKFVKGLLYIEMPKKHKESPLRKRFDRTPNLEQSVIELKKFTVTVVVAVAAVSTLGAFVVCLYGCF